MITTYQELSRTFAPTSPNPQKTSNHQYFPVCLMYHPANKLPMAIQAELGIRWRPAEVDDCRSAAVKKRGAV